MARIYTQKTRKARVCGRCGDTISPGETYQSCAPGFRGPTLIRCSKGSCAFRQSEMTTSKMAGVYAAQEAAEDSINAIEYTTDNDVLERDIMDEIREILSTCGDAIREVAEEYREASQGWAGGNSPNEEWEEKADELDAAADEAEDFTPDDYDPEDEESVEEWLARVKDDAVEHVTGISLP